MTKDKPKPLGKLIVVCGPTATGKTGLALYLADVFGGEILSADSRQVYKDMDVGTGKDLPINSKFKFPNSNFEKHNIGYYLVDGIKIWGYDLVSPTKKFSVAKYLQAARKIVDDITRCNKIPIIAGGTGLYIKGVIDGIETANIPQNPGLRKSLIGKSKEELYEILCQFDAIRGAGMNASDKANPRRLIRAIEIAQKQKNLSSENAAKVGGLTKYYDVLWIGLTSSTNNFHYRIKKRVEKRIEDGMADEVKKLIKSGVTWEDQSMDSFGYREYKKYFNKEITSDVLKDKWITGEIQYTKRQITWFKKDNRINWFDIESPNYKIEVERFVRKWLNK